MKIRSALRLSIFLVAALMLLYIAFTAYFNRTIEGRLEDLRTSSNVRNLSDQLRDTTNEYFLYRMERADQQWRLLHGELLRLLDSPRYQAFQKEYHSKDFRSRLQLMGKSFTKVTVITGKNEVNKDEATQEFQNRLITQITINAREIGVAFDDISRNIEVKVLSLQKLQSLLDIIALILVAVFVTGISLFLSKSVVQPVLKLREGAEIIGRGNLDYKVESDSANEIGQLSRALDQMSANLKSLMVSRDELVREIQERERAEEALQESAKRLRLALDAAFVISFEWDIKRNEVRRFVSVDPVLASTTEQNPSTFEVVREVVYQEDRQMFTENVYAAMEREDGRYENEFRILHPDRRIVWLYERGLVERDEQGQPVRLIGLSQDITERKCAEEALRRARDELEQRVKERTAELERSNATIKKSEENLRFLTSKVISAQEQERQRVSMELHEGLAQSMASLKLFLRAMQRHLPPEAVRIKEDFDGAHNLIKEMIEEVRRISQGLSPMLLEDLGITEAIKHLLNDLAKYQKVTINEDIDDIRQLFSDQTEINLFRVMQESLNNIAKHTRATQVSVSIKKQNGIVNFLIKDNGVGFDLQQISHKKSADKGMGIAAMDERLRIIGASLNITSQAGLGTEISFSIPFDAM